MNYKITASVWNSIVFECGDAIESLYIRDDQIKLNNKFIYNLEIEEDIFNVLELLIDEEL